jgi:hypothetical protein
MLTFLMKVCLKGVICLHNRDLFPEGFEDILYHQQHTFYQSLMLPQNLPKPREILDQYKEEYANLRNHILPIFGYHCDMESATPSLLFLPERRI